MTTARDLAIVALGGPPDRPVEKGDLSLALAGAELFDLVEAGAVVVDGDHVVPGAAQASTGDRLLDEAVEALRREEPYESVEDWLWRRGRGLSSAYADDLARAGLASPTRRRNPLRAGATKPVDAAARHRAEDRWSAGEPVLAALASVAGIRDAPPEDAPELASDAVAAVLAAVGDAVQELGAVRQRKAIEDAAFDNIWRGY